jgi:hypothetical protein
VKEADDLKTQRQRDEQRRREKLADVQEQIDQGTLKVRKMTPQERAQYPPRPPGAGRRRK